MTCIFLPIPTGKENSLLSTGKEWSLFPNGEGKKLIFFPCVSFSISSLVWFIFLLVLFVFWGGETEVYIPGPYAAQWDEGYGPLDSQESEGIATEGPKKGKTEIEGQKSSHTPATTKSQFIFLLLLFISE